MNKYTIYIPTKGRYDNSLTANLLSKYNLKFYLIVEDNEYNQYCNIWGQDKVIKMDGNNFGGVWYARNFIKRLSINNNEKRHWQLDDDIKEVYYFNGKENKITNIDYMIEEMEKFSNLYTNLSILGPSANTFVKFSKKAFQWNAMPHSFFNIDNSVPFYWDDKAVEDVDYTLQCLNAGYCTIKFNIFNFNFSPSGKKKGGWTEYFNEGAKCRTYKALKDKWPEIKLKNMDTLRPTALATYYYNKFRSNIPIKYEQQT